MTDTDTDNENGTPWDARIRARLAQLVDEGRWRSPREFDALGPSGVLEGGGGPVVSFASNDYLGLSAHPAVVAAAHDALARWGAGSGASRLVTGTRPIHSELERALAEWKGTEAAVCFPTGFAANLGVLSTLGGPGVRVLSDELNHASIIDGCRLSRSALAVYRHRDMDHLGQLLADGSGTGSVPDDTGTGSITGTGPATATTPLPTIVVTDSVFSMDGDVAPLDELVALCDRHNALLVLDEAHAVLGPSLPVATGRDGGGGMGGRDRAGVQGRTVVRVGTLSKTLGSLGGFVAASRDIVDLMVNRARSYIFSTAPTPADAAAALAALRIVRSAEGAALTARLAALIDRVTEAGLAPSGHPSPIIPVVLGSEQAALTASAALLQEGLWVPAIRPPTVPVGTSRLRVTLSAAHSDEDVTRLLHALVQLPHRPSHQLPHATSTSTPAAL
jgi:8-amino-7-oxononanoate synthase